MSQITAIFSDVGGVLGTNGWDHESRRKAVDLFHLDGADFEERHALLADALEIGKLGLDEYLERTVFYRERSFNPQQFRDFMFAESQPFPESLALVERLAATRRYFMATLNNESAELNLYRIGRFGLRRYFSVFFSSCYLGVKKPDLAIYRLALDMTRRPPEECLFIDDRALNVECARGRGMRAVQFASVEQLGADLEAAGVL